MTDPMIPDLAITAATLVCSGLVLGVGLLAARHWRARSSVAYLIVKLVIFS
jgi:hypothetical protein